METTYNIDLFKDRLQIFLLEKKITANKLASILGIQASSISHILSGRNNPSYDFLVKMLKCFPDLRPSWLMLGIPPIFKSTTTEKEICKDKTVDRLFSELQKRNVRTIQGVPGRITEILIVYDDNTFRTLLPGSL